MPSKNNTAEKLTTIKTQLEELKQKQKESKTAYKVLRNLYAKKTNQPFDTLCRITCIGSVIDLDTKQFQKGRKTFIEIIQTIISNKTNYTEKEFLTLSDIITYTWQHIENSVLCSAGDKVFTTTLQILERYTQIYRDQPTTEDTVFAHAKLKYSVLCKPISSNRKSAKFYEQKNNLTRSLQALSDFKQGLEEIRSNPETREYESIGRFYLATLDALARHYKLNGNTEQVLTLLPQLIELSKAIEQDDSIRIITVSACIFLCDITLSRPGKIDQQQLAESHRLLNEISSILQQFDEKTCLNYRENAATLEKLADKHKNANRTLVFTTTINHIVATHMQRELTVSASRKPDTNEFTFQPLVEDTSTAKTDKLYSLTLSPKKFPGIKGVTGSGELIKIKSSLKQLNNLLIQTYSSHFRKLKQATDELVYKAAADCANFFIQNLLNEFLQRPSTIETMIEQTLLNDNQVASIQRDAVEHLTLFSQLKDSAYPGNKEANHYWRFDAKSQSFSLTLYDDWFTELYENSLRRIFKKSKPELDISLTKYERTLTKVNFTIKLSKDRNKTLGFISTLSKQMIADTKELFRSTQNYLLNSTSPEISCELESILFPEKQQSTLPFRLHRLIKRAKDHSNDAQSSQLIDECAQKKGSLSDLIDSFNSTTQRLQKLITKVKQPQKMPEALPELKQAVTLLDMQKTFYTNLTRKLEWLDNEIIKTHNQLQVLFNKLEQYLENKNAEEEKAFNRAATPFWGSRTPAEANETSTKHGCR